MYFVSIGLFF
jgi:hypothetical protein